MNDSLIQGQLQYVVPLGVVVVISIASLIIGFLLNAVTFWNAFTTRSACAACRAQCRTSSLEISRLKEEATDAKLTAITAKIDLYAHHTDDLFKHYRLLYGAVMAIATKLQVKIPNIEQADTNGQL